MSMEIRQIFTNQKEYIDLLLLADEQEDMIDKYLSRGSMFVLYDKNELKSVCVVTQEAANIFEIKNMVTVSSAQRNGYGSHLIQYILKLYQGRGVMLVGTGETYINLSFYRNCGFIESHRIENFFTDNYDHPVMAGDKIIFDMVYLKIDL